MQMFLALDHTMRSLLFCLAFCPIRAPSQLTTSLYIPGFDPQPISADIIGVGSDGRTTWALHQGKVDATDTSSYPDFMGTATLVEGPNDASLTYANSRAQFTIGEGCTFSESTLAVCTIVAQGSTATQTEVVSHVPIQLGGTSTGAISGSITNSSSPASPTNIASTSSETIPSQTGAVPAASGLPHSSSPKGGPDQYCSQITALAVISVFYMSV